MYNNLSLYKTLLLYYSYCYYNKVHSSKRVAILFYISATISMSITYDADSDTHTNSNTQTYW